MAKFPVGHTVNMLRDGRFVEFSGGELLLVDRELNSVAWLPSEMK